MKRRYCSVDLSAASRFSAVGHGCEPGTNTLVLRKDISNPSKSHIACSSSMVLVARIRWSRGGV